MTSYNISKYMIYIIDKINKIEQNINEKTKEIIKQINDDN